MVHRFEMPKSLSNKDLLKNSIVFMAFITPMTYLILNVIFLVDTTDCE